MNWQRVNVQAAAAYLRDRIASGADDVRTKAVHEGLLDVLEPTRRTARIQRESAESAKAAVVVQTARERRNRIERRRGHDRRVARLAPPAGVERRAAPLRRRDKNRRG
jgi:hypothetical protein